MAKSKKTYAVWVGNLTENTNEEMLFGAFKCYGPICSVKLGKTKKVDQMHGFVNFYSQEVAEVAAIDMDGSLLDGIEIKTSFKNENHKAKDIRPLTDCNNFMEMKKCGKTCCFRHCGAARGTHEVCEDWMEKQCYNASCEKRHPGSKQKQTSPAKVHHLMKTNPLSCEKCGKAFFDISEKDSHICLTSDGQTKPDIEPVGIFWDIENCQIPLQIDPFDVIKKIREKFLEGKKLVEFICVCDTRKIPISILDQLNKAEVTVIHVSATAKNAADDKLKQKMINFGHCHPKPATVVLISGDVNFAPVLNNLRYTYNLNVILVHNVQASEYLKTYANELYCFGEFIGDIPTKDMKNVDSLVRTTELFISNLPYDTPDKQIAYKLSVISDNCGGKVGELKRDEAGKKVTCIIGFPSADDADRALGRMMNQNVYGNKIVVHPYWGVDPTCQLKKSQLSFSQQSIEKLHQPTLDSVPGAATLLPYEAAIKLKVDAILDSAPYWLSLEKFATAFEKLHKEKFDFRCLKRMKMFFHVDGRAGRKFICALSLKVRDVPVAMAKGEFHRKLVQVLKEHNQKVHFQSIPGMFWSYGQGVIGRKSSNTTLEDLVTSCPGVTWKNGVFLNQPKLDIRANFEKFLNDMVQMLLSIHNCQVPIKAVSEQFRAFFGRTVNIGPQFVTLVAEKAHGILEVKERGDIRYLTITSSKRLEILGKELHDLVERKRFIPIPELRFQYFVSYGREILHSQKIALLVRLIKNTKRQDLVFFQDNDKVLCLGLKKVAKKHQDSINDFLDGLLLLLSSKPDKRILFEDLVNEYQKFHGSCPNLENLGYAHPNDLFKALEPKIMVKCIGRDYYILINEGNEKSAINSTWKRVVNLLSITKDNALLLQSLPREIQENKDLLLSCVPDMVKVIGHNHSLTFFLSSKYEDVVADDASTALCKMLYNSPSFQLTAQEIKDKFDDATMPKMTDALKMLVDIEKIKICNGSAILDQEIALRYFCFEVMALLYERPKNSCTIAEFCGLYHKRYMKQYKVADFGFKKAVEIFDALLENLIEVQQPTTISLTVVGRFIQELKQVIIENNGSVLQTQLLCTHNKKYGAFRIAEHGYSGVETFLKMFPELFGIVPLEQNKFQLVVLKEFACSLLKGSAKGPKRETTSNVTVPSFNDAMPSLIKPNQPEFASLQFEKSSSNNVPVVAATNGAKAKKKGKKKNKKPCGETPVPADHIVPFHEPASQFVEYDSASSDGSEKKKKGKKKNKKPCAETPVPADHIVPFHEPASQFVEYDSASSDGSCVIIESEEVFGEMSEFEEIDASQLFSQSENETDLLNFSGSESDTDWWLKDVPDHLPSPPIVPEPSKLYQDNSVYDLITFDADDDGSSGMENNRPTQSCPTAVLPDLSDLKFD